MKQLHEYKIPSSPARIGDLIQVMYGYMSEFSCFKISIFERAIVIYGSKRSSYEYSVSNEYAMFSGPVNVLASCGIFDDITDLVAGNCLLSDCVPALLKLGEGLKMEKRGLSISEESALIQEGKITGMPSFESPDHDSNELAELIETQVQETVQLKSIVPEEEVPATYTRSEVIEIIKMIRPDIADVQTVIDKLLFKP